MSVTKTGRKLCVWLDPALYVRVKADAADSRRIASDIVAEALRDYYARRADAAPAPRRRKRA